MGTVVGGRCYLSAQEAQDAYFGSVAPYSYVFGASTYEVRYVPSVTAQSGWARLVTSYKHQGGAATGSVSTDQALMSLPSCNPAEQFTDGSIVGWGIASALVMVAAIKMMHKAAS